MDKTTEDRINKICERGNNEVDQQVDYSKRQRKNYLKKIRASNIKNAYRG